MNPILKKICLTALIFILIAIVIGLTSEVVTLTAENEELKQREPEVITVTEFIEVPAEPEPTSIGEFKITYYCPCEKCSEGYGSNTATEVKARANHTAAADPNILPYGTEIIINGQAYTVEDTGGALKGKRIIDIYVDSHDDIPECGTYNAEVFLKDE